MNKKLLLLFFISISILLCFADDDKKTKNHGVSQVSLNMLHQQSGRGEIKRESYTPAGAKSNKKQGSLQQSDEDKLSQHPTGGPVSRTTTISHTVALYAHYTIRHGWFEGIGCVTPEQARHMECYYEFSDKDSDGHWHRVRALDAYGRINSGTYLFQRAFTNLDWDKATWQWDDVPKTTVDIRTSKGDADGDVRYAYYDANGTLQCYGHLRKLSERSYLLHYTDEANDTIPLYRHKVSADCEAIYVRTDENGYNAYLKFFSRHGGLALNTDSAFAVRRTYDKHGNRLTDRSLGITNQPIFDTSGNNGWEATYDARGNELSSTNMDTDWQPMKMPETANSSSRYVCMHRVYDKYDRLIKQYYTDQHDTPMADGDGLAAITYTYNDRGLVTERKLYGLHDIPFEDYGYFFVKTEYDKNGYKKSKHFYNADGMLSPRMYHFAYEHDAKGHETLYECLDETGKLQNNRDEVARKIVSYDEKGDVYQEDHWKLDSIGNLVLSYYRHENADSLVIFNGDSRHIYLKDSNGNKCEDYQTNLDGDTIPTGHSQIYYRDVYHRIVEPHRTTYFRARYDKDNRVIYNKNWDWSESYHYIDSLSLTKQVKEYDADHNVVWNEIGKFSDFGDPTLSEFYNLNDFDVPAWRKNDDYVIYKRLRTRTPEDNKLSMFSFFNEWDEPAYTVKNNKSAYHMIYVNDMRNDAYDVNGLVCRDIDSLFNALPKAISIEVTDSIAYKAGIRDNDIIIKYGEWQHVLDWTKNLNNRFFLETILQANSRKDMVVLRRDETTNQLRVVHIPLPAARLSDLGINPILRCLTKKENQRITSAYESYLASDSCIMSATPADRTGNNWAMIYAPEKKGHSALYSDMKIRSPFIALIQDFYPEAEADSTIVPLTPANQWIIDEETWTNRFEYLYNKDFKKKIMYFTDNLITVNKTDSLLTIEDVEESVYRRYINVSDSIYAKLIELRKGLKEQNVQIRELANHELVFDSTASTRYKPLEIITKWAESPEHELMDRETIQSHLEDYIEALVIDVENCNLYGIQVDEDEFPEDVVQYNELLSRMDDENLMLLATPDYAENEKDYVWCTEKMGKKSKPQIVIYRRNMFFVIEGGFLVPNL